MQIILDANNLWSQTETLQHSKGDRQTESAGGRARERELEIRSISTKYKKNTNACTHTDTYTGRELGSQTDNQSGSQVINTDSHSVNKPFFSQGGRGGGGNACPGCYWLSPESVIPVFL